MIRYKVLIVCEDGQWRNIFKDGRTFKQKKTPKEKMEA